MLAPHLLGEHRPVELAVVALDEGGISGPVGKRTVR
jgi:hypothetical protein